MIVVTFVTPELQHALATVVAQILKLKLLGAVLEGVIYDFQQLSSLQMGSEAVPCMIFVETGGGLRQHVILTCQWPRRKSSQQRRLSAPKNS